MQLQTLKHSFDFLHNSISTFIASLSLLALSHPFILSSLNISPITPSHSHPLITSFCLCFFLCTVSFLSHFFRTGLTHFALSFQLIRLVFRPLQEKLIFYFYFYVGYEKDLIWICCGRSWICDFGFFWGVGFCQWALWMRGTSMWS